MVNAVEPDVLGPSVTPYQPVRLLGYELFVFLEPLVVLALIVTLAHFLEHSLVQIVHDFCVVVLLFDGA